MVLESKDGSDPHSSKNPTTTFIWWAFPSLAAAPMKRSVRPLFSILLLFAIAMALSCRVLTRRGSFSSFELETATNLVLLPPLHPDFNATLLKYAAIDVGEAETKNEIEQLLEGKFASRGRHRAFASWRKFNNHDIRATSSRGIPVMLRSPQFYRHWLDFRRVLRDWARNRRYQVNIMNELVKLVKNPIEKHKGLMGSGRRYNSCAVVGNTGILLQKENGNLIDGHEVVIRLNNARIERFEGNVGYKTNISFVNSNILHLCGRRPGCACHPYGDNVPMVMYVCQPVHFLDYTVCNLSHKAPLIVTDARFDMLCSRIVKYYSLKRFVNETGKPLEAWGSTHDGTLFHYSSGFEAVLLAAGICDRVGVFGFGKSASAKHHYHTNQKAELSLHDYDAEYDFYHDLVNKSTGNTIHFGNIQVPSSDNLSLNLLLLYTCISYCPLP